MQARGNSHRPERIASVIKREVSVIIDSEVSDSRVHGVSVTDVEMSRDLRNAIVFVNVEDDDKSVVDALNGCAGYIRHVRAAVAVRNRQVAVLLPPHRPSNQGIARR